MPPDEDRTTKERPAPDDPGRFGSYRLLEELGRGGFGVVHKALVLEDAGRAKAGQTVALKRLLPDSAADEDARARFLREVDIGLTVRHPALVSLLDCGRASDVHGGHYDYFAMEYVEGGRTLRSWISEGPPLSEPHLRKIALRIVSALDALHSVGVIHRDVKPENILITLDHDIKLADLGIAHVMSPQLKLTATNAFVGSTYYSAPEQFVRSKPLESADFYSLGVVLYEAATGDCPFEGLSLLDVERLHREYYPPKVGALRGQLSLFFEELVFKLLQKEPLHRFARAAELLTILEEGEESEWWQALKPLVDKTGRRGVARRLRVRVRPDELFVGRHRELGVLLGAERNLSSGRGEVLLLEGAAGLGKTRLLAEFIERTDARPTSMLLGSYRAGLGTHEAQGLREALLHRIGAPRLRAELNRYLVDAPWQARLLERHLLGEPPALEDQQSPLAALHAAARAVLRAMSREQPLVLILEDLQHLGQEQAALLEPLLDLAREEAILLVLTRRPSAESEDPLSEALARGAVRRVDPGLLSRDEVEELLTRVLGSRAAAANQALSVLRRTNGNPFFVVALGRDLKESPPQPPPDPDAPTVLPLSLRDLLLERVKRLEDQDSSLIRAAAVMGFDFDPFELAAVVRRDEFEVIEALERLERAGGLIRSIGTRFEFEHQLLRESVEGALPEALSRSLHGRIAEVRARSLRLELAAGSAEPSDDAHFLAHHLLHSREPERGLPWTVAALEQLYRRSRHDELLRLAQQVLAIGDLADACLRARVRLLQSNCLELLGRRDAQHGCARAAMRNAEDCGDEGLLLLAMGHLAYALEQQGKLEEAGVLVEQALARAETLGDPNELARARARAARHSRLADRLAEATEFSRSALAIAERQENPALLARVLIVLGQVQLDAGETEDARDTLRRARHHAREGFDPRSEVSALGNLCRAYLRLGELDTAEERLQEHVQVSRELGFPQGRRVALLNLAGLHLRRGEHGRVRELADEARELDQSPVGLHRRVAELRLAEADLAVGRCASAIETVAGLRPSQADAGGYLVPLIEAFDLQLALVEARPGDAKTLLPATVTTTARDPEDRVQSLLQRAAIAELERDALRHADLVDEALDLARELRAVRGLAAASVAKAKLLIAAEDADGAAPYLRESAEIVKRLRIVEPGPLPAAYLALIHEESPSRVEVSSWAPPLVRAEALFVLHRAGAKGNELAEAKIVLDGACGHLPESDRTHFWTTQPVARAVMNELRGGGKA